MKVVLMADVAGLGKTGDIKDVSDGYARNMLFQRGLALPATAGELKRVEEQKAAQARSQERSEKTAQDMATKIEATEIVLLAKVGEQDARLYGSITAQDIADALGAKLGVSIDKRKVEMDEPIKHIGIHKVAIRLAKGVVPHVTVRVEPETA